MDKNLYRLIHNICDKQIESINQNAVTLKVPYDISAEQFRNIAPVGFSDLDLWVEMCYTVVSSIYKATVDDEKRYAILQSQILKRQLGDEYALVLKTLVKEKLIKKTQDAIIGIRSNGFAFVKKYKKYDYRFVTLNNKKIVNKKRKENTSIVEMQKSLMHKHKELVAHLYNKDFQIDEKAATKYLLELEKKITLKIDNSTTKNKDVKENAKKSLQHFLEQAKSQVTRFNNTDLDKNTPKIQERGGRMYTKVSVQTSELRNFLTYKGQSNLVYLDVKNSQPFHMTIMMRKSFWKQSRNKRTKLTLKEQDEITYKRVRKERKETYDSIIRCLNDDIGMSSKQVIARGLTPENDVKNFCKLVTSGKLYEFISDKFKGKSIKSIKNDPFRDRKSTKQAFIKMLYSDPKEHFSESTRFMKEFKKLFPTVARIITLLKDFRNNDLAFLLQGIEATFILEKICGSLAKEYPEMPLYTIHDGIITTEEYSKLLENKINEVYKQEIGLVPAIKKEELKPEVALKNIQEYSDEKAVKYITEIDKTAELAPQNLEELIDTWREIFEIFEKKASEEYVFGYIPYFSFLESL